MHSLLPWRCNALQSRFLENSGHNPTNTKGDLRQPAGVLPLITMRRPSDFFGHPPGITAW